MQVVSGEDMGLCGGGNDEESLPRPFAQTPDNAVKAVSLKLIHQEREIDVSLIWAACDRNKHVPLRPKRTMDQATPERTSQLAGSQCVY